MDPSFSEVQKLLATVALLKLDLSEIPPKGPRYYDGGYLPNS